jgi:4-methylaminobutanoate oxidase (formaldehyde-forming)
MVSLVLDDPRPVLWGGELIFRDGHPVGHTTSGAYGHTVGASVALAWIDTDRSSRDGAVADAGYEIDLGGERFSARVSLSPPYDRERARILA